MGYHDGACVGGEGGALFLAGPGSVGGGRGVVGTAGREGSRGLRCTLQSQTLAMIAQQLPPSLHVQLNLIASCLP